jgi:hypothetical protein
MPSKSHITPDGKTVHRIGRLAATLALLWAVLVLLADITGGQLACGFDTSDCVPTRAKTMVYEGRLPFPHTSFEVDVSSVRLAGGGLVGGFRTDNNGRYCIVWAPKDGSFVINGSENYGHFYPGMGHVLHGQPPAGCQSGNQNVPWWRAHDLTSSAQYISVIVAALMAMIALAVGIIGGRSMQAARVRATGLILALASTVLFLVVWWSAL